MAAPNTLRAASPKTGGLNKWLIGTALGGGIAFAVYVLGGSEAPEMPEAPPADTPIATDDTMSRKLPGDYSHLFKVYDADYSEDAVVDETPTMAPPQVIPQPPSDPGSRCVRPPTTYGPKDLHRARVDAIEYRDCLSQKTYARLMEDYQWQYGGEAQDMDQGQGQPYRGGQTTTADRQRQPSSGSAPSSPPAQGGAGAPAVQAASYDPADRQRSFSAAAASNSDLYHNHAPEDLPVDACVIPAGTNVPAAMAHAVNPNMAGSVTAIVTQDIYDWTGKCVGIPAWSKIETTYDYQIGYGQESLQAVSTILTTPDGRTMSVGGWTGGDASGMAGLPIDVNNHNLRVFGAAVLGGLIDSLPGLLGLRTNINFSSGSQEIASTGKMLVKREMERKPSAEPIPAGTEINIKIPQHVVMNPEAL